MTMTHDEMIEVIQAHKDGKEIEYESYGKWFSAGDNPRFDFHRTVYRVKPPQIEAWGVVSGGELSSVFHHKNVAEECAGITDTVIRLIPDPNYKG